MMHYGLSHKIFAEVFNFLTDDCYSQEKIENNVNTKFCGEDKWERED